MRAVDKNRIQNTRTGDNLFGFIKALGNLSCIYVATNWEHGRGKLLPLCSIEKVRVLDDPKPLQANSNCSGILEFEVKLGEGDLIGSLSVEHVVEHDTNITGSTGA